jgi:acetyltransferase-like isoleucine patch superfamily enzyme
MKIENIFLGEKTSIDSSTSINNIRVGDFVKVAKQCTLFGNPEFLLEIGKNSYVGMHTLIEGFNAHVVIGEYVSIAQHVAILSGSGPNASSAMQQVFPIVKGEVHIGDHSWIGTNSVIMPSVKLGRFCVVGVNSFVNTSFPDFSIIGGTPARLIRTLTEEEKMQLPTH